MDKIFQEPFTWYLFTTSFKNHELVIGCTIHSICTTHTIQFIQNSDIRNYRYIAWFLAGAAAATFIYLRCGKVDTYISKGRDRLGWIIPNEKLRASNWVWWDYKGDFRISFTFRPKTSLARHIRWHLKILASHQLSHPLPSYAY